MKTHDFSVMYKYLTHYDYGHTSDPKRMNIQCEHCNIRISTCDICKPSEDIIVLCYFCRLKIIEILPII